ncbi:MAG: BON domain-containing protein, partial [Desulfobulbus sp.]
VSYFIDIALNINKMREKRQAKAEQLTCEFRQLSENTFYEAINITIQARKGHVVLTGLVSEESSKLLAEKTVAGLPGVKSVDNRLEIKGALPIVNSDVWGVEEVKDVKNEMTVSLVSEQSTKTVFQTIDEGLLTVQEGKFVKNVHRVKDVNNRMVIE